MKFNAPHFQDETEARRYIEALRWPAGRVCPKCGSVGSEYETKREGRYRCGAKECRKDFTVMTGTVMEASHIKLTVWLMAFYLMASSKKGMSAHQLHRQLDITYKSAWFLAHRIRAAMATGGLTSPMGGAGQIVEADETYFGKVEKPMTTRTDGRPFVKRGAGRIGVSESDSGRADRQECPPRHCDLRSFGLASDHLVHADYCPRGLIVKESSR